MRRAAAVVLVSCSNLEIFGRGPGSRCIRCPHSGHSHFRGVPQQQQDRKAWRSGVIANIVTGAGAPRSALTATKSWSSQ